MNQSQRKETLIIDTWNSSCGNCGKGANPEEASHDTVLGYGVKNEKGCGVKWKYVSSNYSGMGKAFYENIRKMRPDLESTFYE